MPIKRINQFTNKSMKIFHAYTISVINIPKNTYVLGNTENINAIGTTMEYIP